jgi:lipoprotein-anchoring transpeptidase ErfK/SrfK
MHSGQTPVGWHRIWMRIGSGAPLGTVFKARRPTGQIRPDAPPSHGDWITTRILWLEGLEPGLNQGSDVDTRRRYIYIHGTPHTSDLGKPVSAGCVRMEGRDILTLFSRVRIGDPVFISSG